MGIKFGGGVPNSHCKHIGGLNLVVRYRITICILYASKKFILADFNLVVV